ERRGQVVTITVLALVSLLGFTAMVTDFGLAWYAKRQLQASVDAAALAGAQDLPDVATARQRATDYAALQPPRSVTVDPPIVTTKCTVAASACAPANAIVVEQTAHVPTLFARVFGLSKIDVTADATACQPCGTQPFDIMVAMDRSGSMCDDTSECV